MFNSCIICLSETNELTKEHIVPEFVGGTLKATFVCKACNSKMGDSFEGAASKNLLISLPRYRHNIQGKAEKLTIPLPRTGITKEGLKVSLDENFEPYVLTNVSSSLSPDGSYTINATVDAKDKGKVSALVEKNVSRYLAKKYPNLSEDEKDARIAEALSNIPADPNVQRSRSPIQYTTAFDLTDLQFLFLKMAYEITVYHHGPSYLESSTAKKIDSAMRLSHRHRRKRLIAKDVFDRPKEMS